MRKLKATKKELVLILWSSAIAVFGKFYFESIWYLFDILIMFVLPFILLEKKWKSVLLIIIGNIFLLLFQLISMFVKNLEIVFVDTHTFLIGIIYSIDIYIMVFLYYLYRNKRRY